MAAVAEALSASDTRVAGFTVSVNISESASAASTVNRQYISFGSISEVASAAANVSAFATKSVNVTGVQLLVSIGEVLVWAEIDDSQTPNWQNIPT